ncbi:hypothetical protein [Nostoc favosum]|uniref:Uncharacterized protein n=1 Tax=Nostoc favosum CHAB5714 TaxID=2780399 RepID=A0ABS8IHD7_9NOSO|nr:hypothetical protein [Nostoc favosum]MCC5603179.1 hypothetical protein [Nostoc favosum CHAB5714]
MEEKDSISICDNFFERFLLQGKIISQIITFWWTYSDDDDILTRTTEDETTEDEQKKIRAAKILGQCFFPGFDTITSAISKPKLLYLFSADPKEYISQGYPDSYGNTDKDNQGRHVETLITIFGEERIQNGKYLSPIFTSTELGLDEENKNFPYYEFKIDNSGTKFGRLTDPEIVIGGGNSLLKYIYTIPIPPRHLSPSNPRHKDKYEEWIKDEEKMYPPSPHIPFTT